MDTVTLIGRLLVSLAAVLGVMWLLARRMRKGGRTKDTRLIDVLGRQQLSRNASVAVVRVGEQALVVGVTDAQVSVLGETDLGTAQAMVAAASATPLPAKKTRAAAAPARRARPASTRASPPRPSRPTSRCAARSARRCPARRCRPQTWRQTVESLRDLTSRSA